MTTRNRFCLSGGVLVAAALPLFLRANSTSLPARNTGAPGDKTCAECHAGVSPPTGHVIVSLGGAGRYVPGQKQRWMVTIRDGTASRFGFQLSARLGADPGGTQAGSFQPVDPSTQVICADNQPRPAAGCPGLEFIQHSSPSSQNTFVFDWTPPATNIGLIKVYVSGLASNNDGSVNGDTTYTATYTLARAAGYQFTTFNVPSGASTHARALSDAGWIVGYFLDSTNAHRGFLRDPNGSYTFIDYTGAANTELTGINDIGQITGTAWSGNDPKVGFLRDAAGTFSVPKVGTTSFTEALGLNDRTDIAGIPSALLSNGTLTPIEVPASFNPVLPGTSPNSVNNSRWIAGSFAKGVGPVLPAFINAGFLRDPQGTYTEISYPLYGINDVGQTVGGTSGSIVRFPDASEYHFFSPNGTVRDINNSSQITGYFTDNGVVRSYVATPCAVDLATHTRIHSPDGEIGTIQVTADAGCSWSVETTDPWITLQSGNTGTGNGTVNYVVARSVSSVARTGKIAVGGADISIQQPAASCGIALSYTFLRVEANGQNAAVSFTNLLGCSWTAASSAPWLIITSPTSGQGSSSVRFSVLANQTGLERTGILTIGGIPVTISQPASLQTCSATIAPPGSVTMGPAGGESSFYVNTAPGCVWAAISNSSWITSFTNGTGSGASRFTVAPFTGTGTRTGTITVLNQTFTVEQRAQGSPQRFGVFRNGFVFLDDGNVRWDFNSPDRSGGEFGVRGDSVFWGDWFGTGKAVLAVFRAGTWAFDTDNDLQFNPTNDREADFGDPGDIPIVGDWNGDGRMKIGVFRAGLFFLDMNANMQWDGPDVDKAGSFGQAGDIPIAGRWSGGNAYQIGVVRDGYIYLDTNGNVEWNPDTDKWGKLGQAGDVALVGDWSGSGVDRIALFRGGEVFVDMNGNLSWDGPAGGDIAGRFGIAGDIPFVADWNASGTKKLGVFRIGNVYLDMNGNWLWDGDTVDRAGQFGSPGDVPFTGVW